MKKLSLMILMLLAFGFYSCDKNDDITVTINESGSLEMKIIDDNKNPVQNAVVTLTDVNTESMIIKEETNINGVFELKKILQGSYKCFITTEKEGKTYTTTSYFQIFSNDKKVIEINPFSNTGKVNVSVKIEGTVKDITKYMVAVVPTTGNTNSIKESAYFSAPLDKKGEVQISGIPADRNYAIYVYKDDNIYAYKTFWMEKKEVNIQMSFQVGLLNVKVEGEIANYGNYEVRITPYLSYNRDIEQIKANTLFTGKPDSKGKISFTELLMERTYSVYLIKGNEIFDTYDITLYNQNSRDISLRVGSISIKVEGEVSNPANYYNCLSPIRKFKIINFVGWKKKKNTQRISKNFLFNFQMSMTAGVML